MFCPECGLVTGPGPLDTRRAQAEGLEQVAPRPALSVLARLAARLQWARRMGTMKE